MLETRNLTIRFGGHAAVDGVSCRFAPGTLTAIVGPNGAGKTTYFNLLSGQLRATLGSVHLDGEDISGLSAPERARKGLGRAFQLTQLFPMLSVQENVRLAVQAREEGRHRTPWSMRGAMDMLRVWSDARGWIDQARALLDEVRLADKADQAAASLPHGDQRKLEVAMLMALDPKVYMFDEPTAGMAAAEVPTILKLLESLKSRRDKTVLLVEHKLDVVRQLADRIVVLHHGKLVADGEPQAVMASSVVQSAYLGVEVGVEVAA
jgi:branched-chain amino acid transport system ATP-binding protein